METPWHHVANAADVPSPALLIYIERAEWNIDRMIQIAGGPQRLRPHIKTHKMRELVARQVQRGITRFKCATIPEAEIAAEAGAPDVLLAMQPVGPNATRLLELTRAFPETKFSTIVDDATAAEQLSEAAFAAGATVDVLVDLDVGQRRTGIPPAAGAASLYRRLQHLRGLHAAGLHAYDGHIHEPDLATRERMCNEAFAPVEQLAAELGAPRIVAGGTPTFPIHARRPNVECSPGTSVLNDVGYAGKFKDLNFKIAACVLTRIVSKPGGNLITLDLGHKAVAAENPQPRAEFPDLPDARLITHSEEHLVIETTAAPQLEVGHILYAFPKHICPTVALYNEATVVRDSRAAEQWPIARGRKLRI